MKLITKEILKAFEKQGDTSKKMADQITVICKLFNPMGAATWYLYDKEDDDRYWCFANLGDPSFAELGLVSLSELQSIKIAGVGIERDLYFEPQNLQNIIDTVYEEIT